MLSLLFRPLTALSRRKNFLLPLWNEINGNMERYFVIDQRGFVSVPFEMDALNSARFYSGVVFSPVLSAYADALHDFNQAFANCRAFEEVYSSSIDRKTRDNAEKLNAMKEDLDSKLRAIQPCIQAAQEEIRSLLEKTPSRPGPGGAA